MTSKIKNLIYLGLTLAILVGTYSYSEAITQRIASPTQNEVQQTAPQEIKAINKQPAKQEEIKKEIPAVNNPAEIDNNTNVEIKNNKPAYNYSQLNITSATSISKTNPRINLSLRNSDVQQVLRMFADKAGLNIIFHNSARGAVTMDLVNVPINDAFKYVVQVTGLSYYIDGKTIVVYSVNSPMPAGRNMLTTIPVKYVEAAAIAEFLNKNIFSQNSLGLTNTDIVITNPITNELLVFGTHSDILMVEKIVEKFDVQPLSTTFTLNNTTPKEMATLLCNSFILTSPNAQMVNVPMNNQLAKMISDENVLACNLKNQATSSQFSSMNMNNLLVTYFPNQGTINILGGSPQQIEAIGEFIKKNDVQVPQAYFEIVFLELNDAGRKSFLETVNVYSKYFEQNSTQCKQLKNTSYPVFIANNIQSTDNLPVSKWFVNYLVTNKKATLLANPRIVANNAKPAIVNMTSDYVQSKTKNGFNIKNDKGITIEIIPTIGSDGYVTMDIKPQFATEQMKIKNKTDKKEYVTLLQRRNLNLKRIKVKNGDTLILSGLTKDYNAIDKKIFKDKKSIKQSELVIMITPTIMDLK